MIESGLKLNDALLDIDLIEANYQTFNMNEIIRTGSLTHNISNSLKLIVLNAPTSTLNAIEKSSARHAGSFTDKERDTEFDHKRNLKQTEKIANSYARSNTQAQIQRNKVYLASQKICICFQQIEKERKNKTQTHTHAVLCGSRYKMKR